jgi:cytochrome c-type biogenesis protein CcmE
MQIRWKWLVGALILLPVLAHLIYAIVVSPLGNYYLTVEQSLERAINTPIRVGGTVVPGSIRWDTATRTLHFQIVGERATLNVLYRAVAPNALRDQVVVIVEGARTSDSAFIATHIQVRCPHQYLPAGW